MVNWLSADRINKNRLNAEYELFASNYKNFMNSATANDIKMQSKHSKHTINTNDLSDQNDTDSDDSEETIHVTAIYSAVCKMGMVSAFPNLFMAYKGICTLSLTSATVERCFSKLKLIKTKLRSTVGEKRLDNLMLISCNPDIEVSIEFAINKFASTFSVLHNVLLTLKK